MTYSKLQRQWIPQTGSQAAKAGWALSIALLLALAIAQPAAAQTFTVLHEFKGSPTDGANPQAGLVRDAAGNIFGTTFAGGGASEGTIFKLTKSGQESVLFTFNTFNGSFPASSLLLDKAGNLYGTAFEGPGGAGVLFRLAKDGTEDSFHIFEGGAGSQAAVPAGAVIIDQAGNIYGSTLLGGLGFGVVYQIDPAGSFTVLHNFHGTSDGAGPQGSLVRDAAGNIYGAAAEGGARNKGVIFRLATDGTLTVLHTFTGGKDGSSPQGGLLLDQAGNLFGSALKGGDAGNGTIFKVTTSGRFTRLYSFVGKPDGINPNGGLIKDAAGNILGTAQLGGGQGLGTVFKLSPARVLTVLHNFTGDLDGATPFGGLIRDSAGVLYGTADQNFLIQQRGGTVFKITP